MSEPRFLVDMVRFATSQVARRARELDEPQRRHWGRRSKSPFDEASRKVSETAARLNDARDRVAQAQERLRAEQVSAAARQHALETTTDECDEYRRALHEIDAALGAARVQRVLELVQDESPPFYLLEVLGEVPPSRGGQRAWCGLAVEIEHYRDRHAITNELMAFDVEPKLGHATSDKHWSRVHNVIVDADAIIDAAQAANPIARDRIDAADSRFWTASVVDAQRGLEAMRELATPEPTIEAEPDLGLGW